MVTLVDTLPMVYLSTDIQHQQLLLKNDVTIHNNDRSIDSLLPRYESFRLIDDSVYCDNLIVLWFGETDSSLRTALIEYLIPTDINLILFSTEEQLWSWLNTYSSLRVVALVIQTNDNIQDIVCRCSTYVGIRSILIRCSSNDLNTLKQFSRSHIKVNGVFADDLSLLFRLFIDLALYSEEIGDQQRSNENNELNAQRNYDRALHLCALARRL